MSYDCRKQCHDCRNRVSNQQTWSCQHKFSNLDLNYNHPCDTIHPNPFGNRHKWNFHHCYHYHYWILFVLLLGPRFNSNESTYSSRTTNSNSNSFLPFGLWVLPVANAKPDVEYPNVTAKTIAFGSCHKNSFVDESRGIIWDAISKLRPDVFLWTGDAVYTPTKGIAPLHALQSEYQTMLTNQTIGYSRFLHSLHRNDTRHPPLSAGIHGTWDDHDYGGNDYGNEMPQRRERMLLYQQFLSRSNGLNRPSPDDDTPSNHNHNHKTNRNGTYTSFTMGTHPHQLHILLLDTRWGREAHCIPSLGTTTLPLGSVLACLTRWLTAGLNLHTYFVKCRTERRVLEEEQWVWLENELEAKTGASVHVIVSSIQVLTTNPVVESWGHFPGERERLLRVLNRVQQRGEAVVLLSGDVHHAEILDSSAGIRIHRAADDNGGGGSGDNGGGGDAVDDDDIGGILEVTSSGLTHSCTEPFYGPLCKVILNTFPLHRYQSTKATSGSDSGSDSGTRLNGANDASNNENHENNYYTGRNFGSLQIDWGDNDDDDDESDDGNKSNATTTKTAVMKMKINIHNHLGKVVLTTGEHSLSKFSKHMSDEQLLHVQKCVDGHWIPYLPRVGILVLGLWVLNFYFFSGVWKKMWKRIWTRQSCFDLDHDVHGKKE